MSNKPDLIDENDIPEMELSGGVRGKYYERYMSGTNVVLLEPDVAKSGTPRRRRNRMFDVLKSGGKR
jgi:hypothetical protein